MHKTDLLKVDEPQEEILAPIGNNFIYIIQSNKIDIQVGSQRSSHIAVKDMSQIAEVLSTVIPPVYLSEYENLGNIACHIENKDKVNNGTS